MNKLIRCGEKQHTTAMFVVVFPMQQHYIDAYVTAVNAQSDTAFDVLLLRDGFTAPLAFSAAVNVIELHAPDEVGIANNRYQGIRAAKTLGYETLIFSDVDDFFDANRVEVVKRHRLDADIIFNELSFVDDAGEVTNARLFDQGALPVEVNSLTDLLDSNCMGFTHTAVNLNAVTLVPFETNIHVVDWYFFSYLLSKGCTTKFVNSTVTYYRQHDENMVGMAALLSEPRLRQGIEVKLKHYRALLALPTIQANETLHALIAQTVEQYIEFKCELSEEEQCARYIAYVNAHLTDIFTGWWSEISPKITWEKK